MAKAANVCIRPVPLLLLAVGEAEHGLRDLPVELLVGVPDVGLKVHQFLDVFKRSVHLHDGDVVPEVGLLGGLELESGGGAGKLVGGMTALPFRRARGAESGAPRISSVPCFVGEH